MLGGEGQSLRAIESETKMLHCIEAIFIHLSMLVAKNALVAMMLQRCAT